MTAEIIVLRLLHVVGGIFWVGSMLFTTTFLAPTLRELGPLGGSVMAGLQKRKLMVWIPAVALLTILSGARLMWIVSGGFSGAYFASGSGAAFGASAVAATVAFLIGITTVRPDMARAGALGAAMQAADETQKSNIGAELQRVQRRIGLVQRVVAVLLLFAAAGMSVARYMN